MQGKNGHGIRERVILTEDLFSAIKVHVYTGYSVCWLGGTRFDDKVVVLLLDKDVAVATDGDKAGDDAYTLIRKRCDLFNIPHKRMVIPTGYDPKDLKPHELEALLNV